MNDSQATRNSYDYEAFGAFYGTPTENVSNNWFTYTGREWDNESQTYYYRARQYDTNAGRFSLRDRASMVNLYTYVSSNPIMLTDPLGLQAPKSWETLDKFEAGWSRNKLGHVKVDDHTFEWESWEYYLRFVDPKKPNRGMVQLSRMEVNIEVIPKNRRESKSHSKTWDWFWDSSDNDPYTSTLEEGFRKEKSEVEQRTYVKFNDSPKIRFTLTNNVICKVEIYWYFQTFWVKKKNNSSFYGIARADWSTNVRTRRVGKDNFTWNCGTSADLILKYPKQEVSFPKKSFPRVEAEWWNWFKNTVDR